MISRKTQSDRREARQARVRAKVKGTAACPRLSVYKSVTNIYAQIIDDVNAKTLVAASSLDKDFSANGGNKEGAKLVGELIAKKALENGVSEVVFDRGGYVYHGRIQQLAEAAREAGLKF